MNKIEQLLELPKPLSPRDADRLEKFDATEEIEKWAYEAAERRIHHKTTIDWNAPRRPSVLHPSSVDNPCDFNLYLQIMGGAGEKTSQPFTQLIFDTGTAVHAQLQYYQETRAAYYKYQYKAEVGFSPKNSYNAEKLRMAGHIDGISYGWPLQDNCVVWEYKTINENGFGRLTSPSSSYLKQAHLYMLAMGTPIAIIVYMCKNNSRLNAMKVPFNESVWNPLLKRLLYIRECTENVEEPARRISSACKRCRFNTECEPDLSSIRTPSQVPRFI